MNNKLDNARHSPFSKLVKKCFGDVHYVNILNVGDEALLVRIHLIRTARKSINVQTYIWRNDETGELFSNELIKAARRGVKVKLLIDPWASDKNPEWVAFMSTVHPNIEIKYYNPSSNEIHSSVLNIMHSMMFHFKQLNQRMHNKLFIVDDQIGITGGRNYENDYYDRGKKRNFKDRDVLLIGSVVMKMVNSFQEFWNYKLSIAGMDLIDVRKLIKNGLTAKEKAYSIGAQFDNIDKNSLNDHYIEKIFLQNSFKTKKVKFVADQPGKNQSTTLEGGGIVAEEFLKFNQRARKVIIAQTPYLVLDKESILEIKKIRKAHPKLDILISTNSLASTDNIYTYSYACKERKMYVRDLLFRIFEFKPIPPDYNDMVGYTSKKIVNLCIHAKSFVIDNDFVWVGSFNIDPRSFNLNTESALIIEDRSIANAVQEDILKDLAPQNSWTVGRCKKVSLISHFDNFWGKLYKYLPFKKIWPFCYTDNYELLEDEVPVPFYDDRFYDHYVSAGPYPHVDYPLKEIEVKLLKAFIEVAKPIL